MPPRKRVKTEKYKPDVVRGSFSPWMVGSESEDGEQRMFCPLCEEPGDSVSPSASINPIQGVWNCLKTPDHGGSVYALAQALKGSDPRFTLRSRSERSVNINVRQASKRHSRSAERKPLENQDKPYHWHDQMLNAYPERVEYLTEQRGLTREYIERFKVGWDGQRYTIPVRIRGKWINVRRYLPNSKPAQQKILNLSGHGTAVLAFCEVLQANTLPVLLCEGEWDAILANQESAGQYVAVTGTGGASNPPHDLEALANREVFIAHDCDDAGVEGAAKTADRLREVGAVVHVVDLTKLGLPYAAKHGADISDYFCKFGGTADKLTGEFDRLRDDNPAEQDDILRDIETLFMAQDDARLTLIDEVLSLDDIADLSPAKYVIDGWLPEGFFSDFFGEPGAKKTFLILDMLLHICAGLPWHGHTVSRGAALLFEGEGLEQLQARAEAWQEFHDRPELEPFGALSSPLDMTTPEGVARAVRTVRDWEAKHNTKVVCVAFDPLVEYMNGEENGEGMELATRGLRALARYLGIAVVVGAHTNASGQRARGGDQLRMRSGAHVRVEALKNDRVGVVQEKQKNGERLALQLLPVSAVGSIVLQTLERQTAAAYFASKFSEDSLENATGRIKLAEVAATQKASKADALLTEHVRANPGIGKGKLVAACNGQGIGKETLEARVDSLVKDGALRFEKDGPAKNAPTHYYVADPTESA